jgi:hypothetical protein
MIYRGLGKIWVKPPSIRYVPKGTLVAMPKEDGGLSSGWTSDILEVRFDRASATRAYFICQYIDRTERNFFRHDCDISYADKLVMECSSVPYDPNQECEDDCL